jgi:hypothetical protein
MGRLREVKKAAAAGAQKVKTHPQDIGFGGSGAMYATGNALRRMTGRRPLKYPIDSRDECL